MSESYRALCTDFYVNQKLNLKMDLPRDRQTVLDMFDRVRRQFPGMDQFKRYREELALESGPGAGVHQWLAIRNNNVRAGCVNPESLADAYALHEHILEVAPYFMSISSLDVDFLELLYGFDLSASGNHDQIVFDALIAGSPLAALLDAPGASIIDCQPLFGLSLGERGEVEADFEIKTRSGARQGGGQRQEARGEPISVYLTLRKYGPVSDMTYLRSVFQMLARFGEDLLESRVVPKMLVPIRNALASGNA